MLELRCPDCGRANAISDAATLHHARCAECESSLDEDQPVRYFVTDGGPARGPLEYRHLVNAVAAGTLTRDMLLSERGGAWFRAGERSDLFSPSSPRRVALPARPRQRARRPSLSKPPGQVAAMAVLDVVVGILVLLLAFFGFLFAASLGVVADGVPFLLVFLLIGIGHLRLSAGLRRGSAAARNIQLALGALGGVGLLLLATEGVGFALVVGWLVVAVPFLLLLNEESHAWFRGTPDDV